MSRLVGPGTTTIFRPASPVNAVPAARQCERIPGVILYHFGGKDEPTGPGKLRAYIESNLAFMRENRSHMVAILEIALNARAADGSRLYDFSVQDAGVAALQQLLAHFQCTGEFRQHGRPDRTAAP